MDLNFTGIIPARYASSRFPGKPLALINGIPMILRVWEKASEVLEEVYIATDHKEIFEISKKAGANVIMTSSNHRSGTERVGEAAKNIFTAGDLSNQIVINIQGDEPLITREAITGLCDSFSSEHVNISTLIHKIQNLEAIQNPNRPKLVIDRQKNAMYFSRAPIPWGSHQSETILEEQYYQHIGVYAFRYPILKELIALAPTPLEQAEKLEQLRWLENGYKIHCVQTEYSGFGIDSPEDLKEMNMQLDQN